MSKHKRIEPGPGQESVWDYPRPPGLEECNKHIQVIFNGVVVADTRRAKRILETSHPPVYYIPPEDVQLDSYFTPTPRSTFCEWKGAASYYTIRVGDKSAANAAWYYSKAAPALLAGDREYCASEARQYALSEIAQPLNIIHIEPL